MEALVGARLRTPEGLTPGHALLLADGAIRDIVADDAIPATARITRLAGGTLAAGFIDLQVNGGGGVMFNDAPTAATIAAIGRAHRAFGTTGFLATFISGARADMTRAVAAVREAMNAGSSRASSASTSKGRTSTPRAAGRMTRGRSGRQPRATSTCSPRSPPVAPW